MKCISFILSTILLFPVCAFSSATQWQIQQDKSQLTFTATQNDAPVSGQFTKFDGEIYFDENHLAESHVEMTIDMNSVTASYSDLVDTLKMPDWFNVKVFPTAKFKASTFTKKADHTYEAAGTLTIRDKLQPIILTFTIQDMTQMATHVNGKATIKRLLFGVGQGEWASTAEVKDDVQVTFALSALKK